MELDSSPQPPPSVGGRPPFPVVNAYSVSTTPSLSCANRRRRRLQLGWLQTWGLLRRCWWRRSDNKLLCQTAWHKRLFILWLIFPLSTLLVVVFLLFIFLLGGTDRRTGVWSWPTTSINYPLSPFPPPYGRETYKHSCTHTYIQTYWLDKRSIRRGRKRPSKKATNVSAWSTLGGGDLCHSEGLNKNQAKWLL